MECDKITLEKKVNEVLEVLREDGLFSAFDCATILAIAASRVAETAVICGYDKQFLRDTFGEIMITALKQNKRL